MDGGNRVVSRLFGRLSLATCLQPSKKGDKRDRMPIIAEMRASASRDTKSMD